MKWKNVGLVRAWYRRGTPVRVIAERTGSTVNRIYYLLRKDSKRHRPNVGEQRSDDRPGIRLLFDAPSLATSKSNNSHES